MKRIYLTIITIFVLALGSNAQTINYKGQTFEISYVKASVVELNGEEVIKVERDLEALPFSIENLGSTVDEPTFVKLKDVNIKNGIIEVKVLSRIQQNTPFPASQGFIGVAFRVNEDNSAYESIYLRPKTSRSDNQVARNSVIQYYAYPDYKFDKLRQQGLKAEYESYADIGLNEWITMRIEFHEKTAKLYINEQESPAFIVNKMLGNSAIGSIGLWVDIGTEGYFKDLKIEF
jgi:hypothetical protein